METLEERAERMATETVEELAALIGHEDEEVHEAAVHKLIAKRREGLAFALEMAAHPLPQRRQTAAYILGQAGWNDPEQPRESETLHTYYSEAIPVLVHLLETDPSNDVRCDAALGLQFNHDLSALPALLKAATHLSPEVRYGAACALGGFHEIDASWRPSVIEALLKLMTDEDEDVRDWATFGIHLNEYDTPEARTALWHALDDPNPDVRGEAMTGLAKFGDRRITPYLEARLGNDDESLGYYFEAAELLGDPALLPAVREAAQRLHDDLAEQGEDRDYLFRSAIATLEKVV